MLRKFLHPERIQALNTKPLRPDGLYVAYWVQASQRTIYNHALEYSILRANELKLPLVAFFGLTANYPNANQRPYHFMLEGLQQLKLALAKRNIQFVIVQRPPNEVAVEIARKAALLVVDCGYLRIQRDWRRRVATDVDCQFMQVESDAMVPITSASDKEEFAARTIRPKIMSKLAYFSTPVEPLSLDKSSLKLDLEVDEFDISDIPTVIDQLKVSKDVSVVHDFKGGETEAINLLQAFLDTKLANYGVDRNDPSKDATSNMSPYLHFGMISPVYIYNEAMKRKATESRSQFIEELVVRRELSFNYCHYNPNYDRFEGLPAWAIQTLTEHTGDKRPYTYTRDQLEKAATHDQYWNSAQKEAIYKGKIAGYMRMYWGKKVLEWSPTPKEAFDTLVYLNDKYHLDGRDANGYTGVAWCFGKHDRPWAKRPIFGTIRYMVDTGLQRKFNVANYVAKSEKKYREWRKPVQQQEEVVVKKQKK